MAQYKVFLGSGGKFLVCVDIVNVLNACTHVCLLFFFFRFLLFEIFFSIHVSKSLALKENWFSTIGWNMTCRMSHSKQNEDGEIIIPAGQRPAAMKNGALRCKRVCGIFDWPEFSKCAPGKSKNEQTNKLTKKPQTSKQTFYELWTPCKSPTLQQLDCANLVACFSTVHCGLMLHFIQPHQHLLSAPWEVLTRCWLAMFKVTAVTDTKDFVVGGESRKGQSAATSLQTASAT